MIWWLNNFRTLAAKATANIMNTFIIEAVIYVDDMNIIFHPLPPGTRWCQQQKKMIIREDKTDEDSQCQIDERSMREMKKMANSICPIIQMEEDYPSKNADKKLPILDLKVWVNDENIILYEFYRKSMSSRLVMMQRSAMPKSMKRSVLTQEAIRILRNCSDQLPWSRVTTILSDFCLRMKISGYNERYRLNIIKSAIKGWERQKERHNQGLQPMYREKRWNREQRNIEKEQKKTKWYNSNSSDKKYTFPIFCPITPNSKLAEKWRQIAQDTDRNSRGLIKAKIIETGGRSLRSILCKSSPQEEIDCGNNECPVCCSETNKKLVCRKTTKGGTGYEIQCIDCLNNNKISLYHGETSRTLHTRAKEHFRRSNENSVIAKHSTIHHPNQNPRFNIQPTGHFRDSLTRQINEGVRINNSRSDDGYLMNSKSEFHQGVVARVDITIGLD
jgi:hypothetical protein